MDGRLYSEAVNPIPMSKCVGGALHLGQYLDDAVLVLAPVTDDLLCAKYEGRTYVGPHLPVHMVRELIRSGDNGYVHDVRVLDGALRFHLVAGDIWQEYALHELPAL